MSSIHDMLTLKQARERVGLGLRELARDAGVGKDIVYGIESSRVASENVRHGDIVRIFRALRRAGLTRVKQDELFPVL
jgi:predicted transcriptional regulator